MGDDANEHRNFVFSLGLERLGFVGLRAPALVSVLIAIATVLGLIGISKLQVDDSLSELFRTNTEEFRRYEAIDRRFPSSEYDILLVVEGHDLLKRAQLETFAGLTTELQLVDGVSGLVSMLSARGRPDPTGYAPPLVPDEMPADGPAYDAIIDALRSNDIVKGKFLSDDGQLAMVIIALDRKVVQAETARVVIGRISSAVDEELKGSGLTAKMTGAPVMQLEIRNAVERDQLLYNGLGLL
ncbi:MAG: MMPL family transporter, partial [Hyphomicrobium sp.]